MSRQVFSKIKKSAPFKKADVLIYLLVAIIVTVTVLSFIVFNKKYATGFYVSANDEKILTYDFEKNNYTIDESKKEMVEVKLDGSFINFTITLPNGDFNLLSVDKAKRSVKITDANCPHKDCVSFSPIKAGKKNGLIYCSVHDLRVVAIGDNYYIPPTTGELS